MKGAVVVAFMEFVQAQSKAKPQDPSFQIGLSIVINQIVGPTEGERAEKKVIVLNRSLGHGSSGGERSIKILGFWVKLLGVKRVRGVWMCSLNHRNSITRWLTRRTGQASSGCTINCLAAAKQPLKYLSPEGYKPFWNVTRYDDIKQIEGQKKLFINDPRPTLGLEVMEQLVQQMTGRRHLVRSLVQMDDPDHMKYRMLTQGWFMGSNLRKLQTRVDELADKYIDRMANMGGECDFVKDVAIWYPLRVIMSIFGVSEEDEPLMLKLHAELFGSTDPDVNRSFEPAEFLNDGEDFRQD